MNVFSSIDANELTVTGTTDSPRYKDAVIYQLHVKAFADSARHDIGDFAGLTGKTPYLQELGVTALWLLPFYPRRAATTATTSPTMATSIPISGR